MFQPQFLAIFKEHMRFFGMYSLYVNLSDNYVDKLHATKILRAPWRRLRTEAETCRSNNE